jgi:hypothetical protein
MQLCVRVIVAVTLTASMRQYAFPNNCWSDNENASRIAAEIAQASATIGAVEDVLLPAVG